MIKLTTAALFFLAAGIFTSVTILSAYQILFAIPLIWFTYLAIKEKNFKLPTSAWFLLAFAAVAVISLVINIDLVPKPSKNFGRVKYFLFGACGIFVMRAWLKEASDKSKKILLNTFFLSIVAAGIYMIYQSSITTNDRVSGFTNTMRYGYGTAMILLPILSAILQKDGINKWFNWKFAAIALLLGFIGMYLTETRGALLGFLVGLPFVFYFWKPKLGLVVGTILIVVGSSLAFNYFFSNETNTTANTNRLLMNKNNKSDKIRKSQWTAAIIATKEKPAFGYGLSNYHSQLKRIKHQYDLPEKHYDDAHSHNLFLEVMSGTGLIGFFLFLGWIITWAFESFRSNSLIRSLIVPLGVAFVVSSQFEVTFDSNNASMIFFVYALGSSFNSFEDSTKKQA